MEGTPPADDLKGTATQRPRDLDLRALCVALGSDDYEVRAAATDARDALFRNLPEPEPVAEGLLHLAVEGEPEVRREAIETLRRLVRIWPRELTPLVAADLREADLLTRAAATAVLAGAGGAARVPHVNALAASLEDPDPRVATLACSALDAVAEDFPEVVAPHVTRATRFLADEWVPDENGASQVVYDRTDHDRDPSASEPAGSRVTHTVNRPFETALSLLSGVATGRPDAVTDSLPRLRTLLADGPDRNRSTVLDILTAVARANPEAVEPSVAHLRDLADGESRADRVAARNLLVELGRTVDRPEPVSVPELVDRDRPPRNDDETVLSGVDERALSGDLDLDAVLPLLRCTDEETRDTAAWGLSCGRYRYADDIHERAPEFLALLDEPHDHTRTHLVEQLGAVAGTYPEEWVPPLLELAENESPTVRRAAVMLLGSAARTFPALVGKHRAALERRLDDDPAVASAALGTLSELVNAQPAASADLAPAVVDLLANDSTVSQWESPLRVVATEYLAELAAVDPENARQTAGPARDLVRSLAGPDAIDDRGQWGREGSIDVGEGDRTLKAALTLLFRLSKRFPDASEPVRDRAERVVDGRYYGHEAALKLLVTLDADGGYPN